MNMNASAVNVTGNGTGNGSVDDYVSPDILSGIVIVAYVVVFVVGLVGNFLVCFAVWRCRSMRTVTNIFMVNLAITDMTILLVVLPYTAIGDLTQQWLYGSNQIVLCKFSIGMTSTANSVSILTLTAVSIERYYAICHPLRFHSTVRRARYTLLVIWVLSVCVSIYDVVSATLIENLNKEDGVYCGMGKDYMEYWSFAIMCIFYVLPVLIMTVLYTRIAIALLKDNIMDFEKEGSSSRNPMVASRRGDNNDELRRKAVKMLAAITVIFAVCMLPNHIFNICRYLRLLVNNLLTDILANTAHIMIFVNSCVNPIVYNFMSEKFRKEFRKMAGACLTCGQTDEHVAMESLGPNGNITEMEKLTPVNTTNGASGTR